MANNKDKTAAEIIKTLLAISDALDQKLTNIGNNIKA